MRTKLSIVAVCIGMLLAAVPVWAHHALIAQFDISRSITLKGTLTKMVWVNPHGWIYLDVKGPDGRVENWAIETGSPFGMEKRGLKKTDFRPGEELIVGGFAAKDGTPNAAGWIVAFPAREALGQEASFSLGR